MGLDTTHGCWHGGYISFSLVFREALARAAGYGEQMGAQDGSTIDWDKITAANNRGRWNRLPKDPLVVLMVHSDCDGYIPVRALIPLADRMEGLLPAVEEIGLRDSPMDARPSRDAVLSADHGQAVHRRLA